MEHKLLNIDKIREKISDIKSSLYQLRRYSGRQEQEFVSNQEMVAAARYFFIVVIEASMNIANHLCARLLDKAPSNYAETFLLLGENGLISSELAENLAKMARFRNLLVHGYGKVDDRRMLKIIQEDLVDIDEFVEVTGKIVFEKRGE